MKVIEIKVLQTPQVLRDGLPLSFLYKKVDALFYYMACNKKATRSELVELLWSDSPREKAHKNLRHTIHTLRKELGCDILLAPDRTKLLLNPDIPIDLDLDKFLLHDDVDAYRGHFLQNLSIKNADLFENWVSTQRSYLRQLYLKKLSAHAQAAAQAGDHDVSEAYSLAYLREEPLDEEMVVSFMKQYQRTGKYRKAISEYQNLSRRLADELGLTPQKETTAVYYRIVDEWSASAQESAHDSDVEPIAKDRALQKLLSLYSQLSAPAPARSLLIQGEAGVGKTFLLDFFQRYYDLSDSIILHSSCYQGESATSLAPWNSIMMELMNYAEDNNFRLPESHRQSASHLFPIFGHVDKRAKQSDLPYSQYNYHAARDGALMLLASIARDKPLLLLFEDVHWMDRLSLDMLDQLLRRLRSQAVAVVCTSRDILQDEATSFFSNLERDGLLEYCTLNRFSEQETAGFVKLIMETDYTEEAIRRIYDDTGGNPLLLVQLLSAMKESDDIGRLPSNPDQIITYRLSGLSAETYHIITLISLFPDYASFDTLVAVTGMETLALLYLCKELKKRGLIAERTEGGNMYLFLTHQKIGEMLDTEQTTLNRRILHLRIAHLLEEKLKASDEKIGYERLIYHFEAGGDRLHAFHYKVLSLDSTISLCYELLPIISGQSQSAVPTAEDLLGYFKQLEAELRDLRVGNTDTWLLNELELIILHVKGSFCIHDGIYELGVSAIQTLIAKCEQAHNTSMLLRAHRQMVYYYIQTCDWRAMGPHVETGLRLAEEIGDVPEKAIFLRLRGLRYMSMANYEEGERNLQDSIAFLSHLEDGSSDQYVINVAGAHNYLGECYRLQSKFAAAYAQFEKAISLNKAIGLFPGTAVFYTNYGQAAFQDGNLELARNLFTTALSLYRNSREYSGLPIALAHHALFASMSGQSREAVENLAEAAQIAEQISCPAWSQVVEEMGERVWEILKSCGAHGLKTS